MDAIELLGWAGRGLVLLSLSTSHPRRFRQLNLVAAVALLVFNLVVGLWSMVVMNAVIAAIDVWHLAAMRWPPDPRPNVSLPGQRHSDEVDAGGVEPPQVGRGEAQRDPGRRRDVERNIDRARELLARSR